MSVAAPLPLPPSPASCRGGAWRGARRLLLVLLAALASTGAASAQEQRFFRIGTAATTGSYFQIGGVIASALSNPPGSPACQAGADCGIPGVVAIAQATQGSIENVHGVASAQFESAFVQADVAHWAWRGDGPYASKGAVSTLRALAALFPESVHIVVRRDGPIAGLADLKGRRIALGERESGTLADARLILAAAGLKEQEIAAKYLRLAQAASGVADGSVEGFFLVGGYPVPGIAELAAAQPIRLVPIADDVAEKLRRDYRFFGRSAIPGNVYEGLAETTPTLEIRALLVASAELPETLAYNVVKTLWSERTKRLLETRHPLGKRIRLETGLDGIDIPLHPGAERFYHELGLAIETPKP
jgi:TRAP transporter TAXI family solute receptor